MSWLEFNPRRHRVRAGFALVGGDEGLPLCDLLGVQQLGRADRFDFELPSRFAVHMPKEMLGVRWRLGRPRPFRALTSDGVRVDPRPPDDRELCRGGQRDMFERERQGWRR